jgi:hypothetical protein
LINPAEVPGDGSRDVFEQEITDVVPVPVVDLLEVVEIHEQQRQWLREPDRALEFHAHLALEERPVVEAGQRVLVDARLAPQSRHEQTSHQIGGLLRNDRIDGPPDPESARDTGQEVDPPPADLAADFRLQRHVLAETNRSPPDLGVRIVAASPVAALRGRGHPVIAPEE